jgi:hypothetical protein
VGAAADHEPLHGEAEQQDEEKRQGEPGHHAQARGERQKERGHDRAQRDIHRQPTTLAARGAGTARAGCELLGHVTHVTENRRRARDWVGE